MRGQRDKERHSADKTKNAVERCYERVPFYRKKFDEIGLRPNTSGPLRT